MMSSPTTTTNSTMSEEQFIKSVHEKNSAPLWTVLSKMVPPFPNPKARVTSWKYEEMRPSLMEAGRIVGAEEAERRVLMLVNSNMEAPYTTDTLYSGLQLVLPGETAPAHRHVAFALRFIVEGKSAFTAVEGQKIPLARGDVILTPQWHWHDHGNESNMPMIWLDGLDLPLFRSIPVNFAENYSESRYPSIPTYESHMLFPWKDVRASLDKGDFPYSVHHYNRKGRKHLSYTISCQAERVVSGTSSPPSRETCSFVYHIESGSGSTRIHCQDGAVEEIKWSARDTFAVPAWSEVQHTCTSTENAYLFAINDRPLLESLGFYRKAE